MFAEWANNSKEKINTRINILNNTILNQTRIFFKISPETEKSFRINS